MRTETLTLWRAPRQSLAHSDETCSALHMWASGCATGQPALDLGLDPETPLALEIATGDAEEMRAELLALGLTCCPCASGLLYERLGPEEVLTQAIEDTLAELEGEFTWSACVQAIRGLACVPGRDDQRRGREVDTRYREHPTLTAGIADLVAERHRSTQLGMIAHAAVGGQPHFPVSQLREAGAHHVTAELIEMGIESYTSVLSQVSPEWLQGAGCATLPLRTPLADEWMERGARAARAACVRAGRSLRALEVELHVAEATIAAALTLPRVREDRSFVIPDWERVVSNRQNDEMLMYAISVAERCYITDALFFRIDENVQVSLYESTRYGGVISLGRCAPEVSWPGVCELALSLAGSGRRDDKITETWESAQDALRVHLPT